MDLLLVRHAPAAPLQGAGSDASRPLSEEGRALFARAARGLERLGIDLDVVFHSPLVRASQTAEALSRAVGGTLRPLPELAEPPTPALLDRLRGQRAAAVGHAPWVGQITAWLLTGRPQEGAHFPFPAGGAALLAGLPEAGGMILISFWTPATLAALAP